MKPEFPREYSPLGTNNFSYTDIIETSDEGYLFFGSNPSAQTALTKVFKTNKKGYLEWSKDIDSWGFRRVKELSNGNFLFVGFRHATDQPSTGVFQITDRFGNIISTNSFPNTKFHDLSKTSNDTFILAGATTLSANGQSNGLLLRKINIDGTLIWEKTMSNSGYNEHQMVITDAVGNIYTVAQVYGNDLAIPNSAASGSYRQLLVFKFDENGNELWKKYVNIEDSTINGVAYGLAFSPDGNLVVSGVSKYMLVKLSATDGSNIWSKYLFTSPWSGILGGFLQNDGDGLVSVINYTPTPSGMTGIARMNNDGNLQWVNSNIGAVYGSSTLRPLRNGGYIYVQPVNLKVYKMNAAGQLIPE